MMNVQNARHVFESVGGCFKGKNQMSSLRAWLSGSFILRTAEAAAGSV